MIPLRRVALTTVFSVGAFVVGRAWSGADGSPSLPDPVTPTGTTVDSPALQTSCPDVVPIRLEADALSRELGRLQAELLVGQLDDAKTMGLPDDWPREAGELWREESIEGLLEEALGDSGRLLTLDCSEYPCMAVVMPLSTIAPADDFYMESDRIRTALQIAGLKYRSARFVHGLSTDDYLMVETMSFELPGHAISDERWRFRTEDLRRSVQPLVDPLLEKQAQRAGR